MKYFYLPYVISAILSIILFFSLTTVGSQVTTTTIILDTPVIKTIDSEITRLSTEYKVDEVLVRKIIKCESQMYGTAINRNKRADGTVWSSDWGLMQINDYYHEKYMASIGLDIHDQYDSLEYGIMLLSTGGTKFWNASKYCWSAI